MTDRRLPMLAASARYPADRSRPAAGYRGQVEIDWSRCTLSGACVDACPTDALTLNHDAGKKRAELTLDHGHCVFCSQCQDACSEGAIRMTSAFEMSVRKRTDLIERATFDGRTTELASSHGGAAKDTLTRRARRLLGRSLRVRAIDAGSCNGCEEELHATADPNYDLARLGIELVGSPHHADLLLVTGPVTRAMTAPLKATLDAMPRPRVVAAMGTCAIGGGIYRGAYAQSDGLDAVHQVDLYIPGCPPRPEAIIYGLLLVLDKLEQQLHARRFEVPYPTAATP